MQPQAAGQDGHQEAVFHRKGCLALEKTDQGVESLPQEMLKKRQDMALSAMVYLSWWCSASGST